MIRILYVRTVLLCVLVNILRSLLYCTVNWVYRHVQWTGRTGGTVLYSVLVCRTVQCPVVGVPRLVYRPAPVFVDLLRSPGIDFQPGGPVRQPYLSYRPTRLHRLAESISRNLFLGSINVYKYGLVLYTPPSQTTCQGPGHHIFRTS